MGNEIIKLKKITKDFGKKRGIFDLDLSIKKGEIVGFLGPNGAGKSTTIDILLGLTSPTSGDVELFGEKVSKNDAKNHSRVGFLSTDMQIDNNLTGRQALEFLGNLKGGYNQKTVENLAKLITAELDIKIRKLSRGNRQKISLISAIMNDPELLIMDEPTSGFDPIVEAEFVKLIKCYRKNGGTVFISSHILSEIEEIADRVIFINQGKIVEDTTMNELRKRAPKKTIIDLDAVFMKYYQAERGTENA